MDKRIQRFVGLLWTLPTPHTFLVVGSAQESSDPFGKYGSCRLSNFKFDIWIRGAEVIGGQREDYWEIVFSLKRSWCRSFLGLC